MKFIARISALVCFSLCSTWSFAWWEPGHKLVAMIAYQRLTPEVKSEVDKLVVAFGRDYPSVTQFSDLAPWPDSLRGQKIESFTHWHYINRPYTPDKTPVHENIDTDNAVRAMELLEPVLKNNNANTIEKARFLAFAIHILGDLHQPLHTITLYSANHLDGDRGGNLYMLKNPSNPNASINLHSLWDSNFGSLANEAHPDLNKLTLTLTAQYPESFFGDRVKNLSAERWSDEGGEIAKKYAYAIPENQMPAKVYQSQSEQVINQQLVLAGYRLANYLNSIMGHK